ncbi:Holliday junction branch migration protein RuvA [Rhodovulum sp. YNF3179]|uniref:Holliday junction branch migration protein RuvA n=1 Tax=Rhodovulum sp. YNF3179 TaxID=3425127 RepID=UPI003D336AC2
MIGRIAGIVDYRGADHVLIDVRGVGYVIHCSDRTLAALPGPGEAAALYTDLLVREDLLQLYGFTTLQEREWHRLLTTVQGVGAKASMAILGTLGPDGVSRAIALGDWAAIKAAPGVGPKIAQRVVNELKDKAPQVMALGATVTRPQAPAGGSGAAAVLDPGDVAPEPAPAAPAAPGRGAAQAEALSALVNLGYSQGEAASAVATAAGDAPEADTAAVIRAALKLLAPKG